VWVAKVPPKLPFADNTSRNGLIEQYNTAIDNLTSIQAGPDFFSFAYDDNDTPANLNDDVERGGSLTKDGIHPNSLGHRIAAQLWHNAYTGATTEPFYLDKLCNRLVSTDCSAFTRTNHRQNLLQVGSNNQYYVDETFTPTSIPTALAGGIWIMTKNSTAERTNNDANYIEFVVDRAVSVYVAYDAGASSLPAWLNPATSDYQSAGLNIQVTDPASPTLNLYWQDFAAGTVDLLGGNLASGASGSNSNYVVVVVEQ
jgi:hypothetical protein